MVVFTSNPSPLEIRLVQHARIAGVRIDAGLARELAVTVASRRGGRIWWEPRCTCRWHGRQTTIVQRATAEHAKHATR